MSYSCTHDHFVFRHSWRQTPKSDGLPPKSKRHDPSQTKRAALSILLVAVLVPVSQAELSPAVYKQMQKNAPEFLEIEVLSVKTTEVANDISVDVEARLTRVRRSKSGLKAGDVIHINYGRRTQLLAGPSPAPLLEKNKKYPAFVVRAHERNYEPAAGGKSFEVID